MKLGITGEIVNIKKIYLSIKGGLKTCRNLSALSNDYTVSYDQIKKIWMFTKYIYLILTCVLISFRPAHISGYGSRYELFLCFQPLLKSNNPLSLNLGHSTLWHLETWKESIFAMPCNSQFQLTLAILKPDLVSRPYHLELVRKMVRIFIARGMKKFSSLVKIFRFLIASSSWFVVNRCN